jgi:DNA-binding NtrC family response regulator
MNIPPLRERKDDIPYLVEHFAKKYGGEISEGALVRLMSYHWPGNVRELENVIERSILLAQGPRVEADDIKIEMGAGRTRAAVSSDAFLPEGMTLDQYEQSIIREALKRADGNKSQAARLLGLTRNALRYRLAQMGIE